MNDNTQIQAPGEPAIQPPTPDPSVNNQPSPNTDNSLSAGNQNPAPPPPRSSRKKLYLLLSGLVILLAVVLVWLFLYKDKSPTNQTPAAKAPASQTLSAALPQFPTSKSVAGYLKFDSSKFKPVDTLKNDNFALSASKDASPKVNTLIFQGDLFNINQSGLYLYDIAKNQTYKITDGGGSPRIMSDHFLLYGLQTASGQKATNSAVLLNMLTGEKKTVVEGDATDLANSFCCTVSPDGFKLAIPRAGKIDIWDIRDDSTISIPAQINPFHVVTGAANVPYYDEIDYPTMAWLDNQTLIFADKPPTDIRVDSKGNVNNDPVANNLYTLDVTTKKRYQAP